MPVRHVGMQCMYVLALTGLLVCFLTTVVRTEENVTTVWVHITFASCNRQGSDQSYWDSVIPDTIARQRGELANETHTDVLLWLGNAVYASVTKEGLERTIPLSPVMIEEEYMQLINNTHYRRFVDDVVLKRGGQVLGIFDDHDLGFRGADKAFTHKKSVQDVYRRLIHAPSSAKGDSETTEGLYTVAGTPAPAGSALAKHFVHSVCVLTLDVRSERNTFPNFREVILTPAAASHGTTPRESSSADDILGHRQWAWLERTIATYVSSDAVEGGRKKCAVTLISSPWQILLNDNKPFAGWDLYPASRTRLLDMLRRHNAARVVFLSGHAEVGEIGEFRRHPLVRATTLSEKHVHMSQRTDYAASFLPHDTPLVEVTSSGVTHTVADAPLVGRLFSFFTTPRAHRAGPAVSDHLCSFTFERRTTTERNFGTVRLVAPPGTSEDNIETARVIIAVHAVRDGSELLRYEASLNELPSFTQDPSEKSLIEEGEDASGLNYFAVYSSSDEYPWLKRVLLWGQCAEVPCVSGQYYIFVLVGLCLFLAFVTLTLLVLVIAMCQRVENEKKKQE